jgi:hypothetical protein
VTAKPRIVAAVVRLTAPRRPSRRQRIAQQRQAEAWLRKAEPKSVEPQSRKASTGGESP